MVIEYEESMDRLGWPLAAHILLEGKARVLSQNKVIKAEDLDGSHRGKPAIPAVFSPKRRMEVHQQLLDLGFVLGPPLIDPSAVVAKSSRVGDGSFINPNCTIAGGCFIGENFMMNRNCRIGHHTFIEDYVSLAPGVTVAGTARIGRGAIIGIGAVIYPDIKIGERAIVSGGSVVRKDVRPNTLVAGNPAVAKDYDITQSIFDQTVQE